MGAVTTVTLEDLRDPEAGECYPRFALEDAETALVIFCAGFYGKQDAFWIADAGITATCVDTDEHKLQAMLRLYPPDWTYIVRDAYDLPEWVGTEFDVVSLDPWTQDFQKCADRIEEWCGLAKLAVVLGTGWDTQVVPPDGWRIVATIKRSDYNGGVYWTVLEPV